jgi:hypothetical protein
MPEAPGPASLSARKAISPAILSRRIDLAALRPPLDDLCQRLLREVRERCPELLPRDPVPAGTLTDPVTLDPEAAVSAIRLGMEVAAGLRPDDGPTTALWRRGDQQLLVHLADVHVKMDDGIVLVAIPVACDQERGTVLVTLAIGGEDRVAGLLAATQQAPEGPPTIVAVWGEELIALAWHGLLEAVSAVAGATGHDADGTALIPAAMSAAAAGLTVTPIARFVP